MSGERVFKGNGGYLDGEGKQHLPRNWEFSPEFSEANPALSFSKWTWKRWVKIQKYCIDDSPAAAESKTTILSQINGEPLSSNFLFGNLGSKQRVRSGWRNITHVSWNMPFCGVVKLIDDTSGPLCFNLWTVSLTRSSGNVIFVQKGNLCVLQHIFCTTSTSDFM